MRFLCNIFQRSIRVVRTSEFPSAELELLEQPHLHADADLCSAGRRATTNGFITEELCSIPWLVRYSWLCLLGLVAVCVLGLGALIAMVSLMETMPYLAWMLFSFAAPLIWAFKALCTQLREYVQSGCTVSVHVRASGANRFLARAFAETLRKLTLHCEADLEVEKTEEAVSGAAVYKLALLPKTVKCCLRVTKGSKSHTVEILSLQRDAVVCGPKHELLHPMDFHLCCAANSRFRFFSLPLRSDPGLEAPRLAAKQVEVMAFVQEWLDDMYVEFMRASVGMVTVLELQKESTDWAPEWQEIRKERAVNRRGGTSDCPSAYYSVQPWAAKMLKHAEFAVKHKGRNRTTLFLHGEKGSGKTLFVEWLASELGIPIYYIDLRAPFLDDSVLRDSITPRKLRHNLPVIFHVDEFQSMMEAWVDRAEPASEAPRPTKITIQGLQSLLEGIATPSHALFVFTGSRDVPQLEDIRNETWRHEWEGLLRRLPVREIIPLVGKNVVRDFFANFLAAYLPNGVHSELINSRCDALIGSWGIDTQPVPFDMLAKYAEQQLRTSYVNGLLVLDNNGINMRVPPEQLQAFMHGFFQQEPLASWPATYAGGARSQ